VAVGSVVRIAAYESGPVVAPVYYQTAIYMPAVGIVSAVDGASCTVQTGGVVDGLSGLSAGETYYAGSAGGVLGLAEIMETSGTRYVQALGVATSPTAITISINPTIFAVVD
jgi:hypothetical protein